MHLPLGFSQMPLFRVKKLFTGLAPFILHYFCSEHAVHEVLYFFGGNLRVHDLEIRLHDFINF